MSIYDIPKNAVDEICCESVSGSNPHRSDVVDLLRQDASESRRSTKISLEELDSQTAEVLGMLTDRMGASALSAGFRIRTVTAYGASEVTEAREQLVIQGKESPEDKEWFEKAFSLDRLSAEQLAAAMEVCQAITKSQRAAQVSTPKINGHKLGAASNPDVKPYDKNPVQQHFIRR